jgi:hypothetical protein
MILETKFEMYQEVIVKKISWPGIITCIKLEGLNLYYGVEYWRDLEPRNVFVLDSEIKASI